MDPSLMTAEELEARERIVIDPCLRDSCRHNHQAHVYIPRAVATGYFGIPITACLACTCSEFRYADG